MSESVPMPCSRPPSTLRTSLWFVTFSGMLFTVYIACTNPSGPLAVEFFKKLGANDFHFGLMTGVAQVMIAMLFVGAMLANAVSRRKPLFMAVFIIARAVFIPIVFLPLIFRSASPNHMMLLIIGFLAVSHAMTHVGSMMWQSWMADLIPHCVLNHYWGVRQRAMSIMGIACSLTLAGVMWVCVQNGVPITTTFPILVIIGVVAGVVDIVLFVHVHEPQHHVVRNRHIVNLLTEPVRDRAYRGFLGFQCLWAISACIGGAYVWVYSVEILKMPGAAMVLLLAVHGLGMGVSGKLWGKLADKHGHKPILLLTLCLKPMFLLGFGVSTSAQVAYFVLPPILLLDGFLNGGLFLAINGYQMKCSPRENRPMFIAASSGLCGICAGMVTAAVGWMLSRFEGWSVVWHGFLITRYHVVFVVSMLLRWSCVPLTAIVHEPTSSHPRRVLEDIWARLNLQRWANSDDEKLD